MAKKAKPVKKAAAKKPAAKKPAPKKTAAAKPAVKKAAPKKAAVKKPAEKAKAVKPAAKKTVAKKTAPKKSYSKPVVSKAPVKKAVVKTVSKPKTVPAKPAPVVEKQPVKKPIKKYSKEELNHFKKIILAKQSEAIENLQSFRDQMLDPSTGEYINENSPYSLHMAEQGTDAMEKEKTYFYAQREQKLLGYLEEALKRIELGTYGLCTECADDPKMLCETCPLIPKARLEAVPHSQLCAQIKKLQEKPRRF